MTLDEKREERATRALVAIAGLEAGISLRKVAGSFHMSPSALVALLVKEGLTERYDACKAEGPYAHRERQSA